MEVHQAEHLWRFFATEMILSWERKQLIRWGKIQSSRALLSPSSSELPVGARLVEDLYTTYASSNPALLCPIQGVDLPNFGIQLASQPEFNTKLLPLLHLYQ